jgi:hypothetical protein
MAELRLRLGEPRAAARLLGAAHRYRAITAQPLDSHEGEELDAVIEETQATTGQIGFSVAWAQGEALTLEQAVDDALSWSSGSELPTRTDEARSVGGGRTAVHSK